MLISGITLAILSRGFPEFVSTKSRGGGRSADKPGWVDPEELRSYLKKIRQTMEEEGFGGEPAATLPARAAVQPIEQEREGLVVRGHELLADMALNARSPERLFRSMANQTFGYPAVLAFVRDGQAFVSRVLPGRADPGLINAYENAEEARLAIQQTLDAIGNVGHDLKPWRDGEA